MKRIVWVLLLYLLCQGCISGNPLVRSNKLDRLTAGMTEEKVAQIAGPADERFDYDKGRFVLYYRNDNAVRGSADLEKDYTAVSFEEGRVITIGQDLKEIWESPQDDPKSLSAMSEEERQIRIKALEEKVRPIPTKYAAQNLNLYKALLTLDPKNRRYRQKVAFYRARIKLQAERTEPAPKPLPAISKKVPSNSTPSVTPKSKTTAPIQIEAVKIRMGVYFVWIKNSSNRKLTIGPDTFAVLDDEKQLIQCALGPELVSTVSVDKTVQGEMQCPNDAKPHMLLFTHVDAEPIVKMLN